MAFTAKDVQELRQRTGAGMMDCKRALEETSGDMEKAVELLRMKGIAKAEKRAGRAASEGQIVSASEPGGKVTALLELNCETDFVARTDDFARLAGNLAAHVLGDSSMDGVSSEEVMATFLAQKMRDGQLVEQVIKDGSARMGENIVVRRFARFVSDGVNGVYIHHNGKVASIVDVAGGSGPEVENVARSVAEHVTAGVPSVALGVSKDDVPASVVDRERRIFEEQAKASGKPDNIIQKMISGRVEKYYKEVSLLEQPWVRDDTKTIRQLLEDVSRKVGGKVTVRRFARFQMGE
jgi:elongation factor Ts